MEYCFYLDWKGWSPEVWAAWAQAILSAVAIVVAARMAINTEKRATRRKVEAFVAILHGIHNDVEATVGLLETNVDQRISDQWLRKMWEKNCDLLDNIPFHDMPDYGLYAPLSATARGANAIRDIVVRVGIAPDVVKVNDVRNAETVLKIVETAIEHTEEISNELAVLSLRHRWSRFRLWLPIFRKKRRP